MGGGISVFDDFETDDLILSFFPCTRFESRHYLLMRCEQNPGYKWDAIRKLEYSMKIAREQAENYQLWCKMFWIVRTRGLRMIVENPATLPTYLNSFFCERPSIVDNNRRERGDWAVKPTAYWFVNIEPRNNILFDVLDYAPVRNISTISKNRELLRSEIHPQYAKRFIREFILDEVSS